MLSSGPTFDDGPLLREYPKAVLGLDYRPVTQPLRGFLHSLYRQFWDHSLTLRAGSPYVLTYQRFG
jgi:hypothetical protein